MRFLREISVRPKVQVCIVGGGPAGCAAAIIAARNDAEVYLAEAHTCFGGLGTAGGVPLFMTFSDGINFVADGIGREILERLNTAVAAPPSSCCINAEALKRVYDEMLPEAGARFSLMTELIAVEAEGGKITHAIFNSRNGIFAVPADVFVDCSGDGALCAGAGAEFMLGDENHTVMPATLCSAWANIDWARFRNSGVDPRQMLQVAFKDGIFRNNDPHHTGINPTGRSLGGGNMGHIFKLNPLDEASLTECLMEGRRQAVEFERFYREYVAGFEKVELAGTASLPGVRESRRIVCDYVLGLDDYKAKRVFDDEIGRYCYPVDIHPASPDQKDQEEFKRLWHGLRYQAGESYGIPYRTLTVKNFNNLLVAGRCVSADRYLQSSIRVMPGCYLTGQAAGAAAALALAAGNDTRKVALPDLKTMLKQSGAYLPNF